MKDKVPASSAKNMALPNLTSDLGTAHNAGHVPESLQEPALCASCISMCQFGYYTQLQCPLQATQRSSHLQTQMCKNFGSITGCKRTTPKCTEQDLSLGSCSPKAYPTLQSPTFISSYHGPEFEELLEVQALPLTTLLLAQHS